MNNIEVHHITAAAIDLLARVADDVFDDELDPSLLAAYLADEGQALIVARVDGLVIGQARGVLNRQPDAPTALFLDNLGVAPAWRRQGIATRLVEALVTWGRRQGCEEMWTALEAHDDRAQAFYAKTGFALRPVTYAARRLTT